MRNHVEGKFGQGKNAYGIDRIRARRKDTAESWISAILFIMNLTKMMKVANKYVYFSVLSVWEAIRTVFFSGGIIRLDPGLR